MVTPTRPAASHIIVPKEMSSLAGAPFGVYMCLLWLVSTVV